MQIKKLRLKKDKWKEIKLIPDEIPIDNNETILCEDENEKDDDLL